MAFYGSSKVEAPAFKPGRETSEPIRQQNRVIAYDLTVRGNITVAGNAGGAGAWRDEAAYMIARYIKIMYGTKVYQSWHGDGLFDLLRMWEPELMEQQFPTSTANGVYPFEVVLKIPFYMPRSYQPDAFSFATWQLNSWTFRVEWATGEELATGLPAEATVTFSDVETELYERTLEDWNPNVAAAGLLTSIKEHVVLGTQDDVPIKLEGFVAGHEVRAWLIHAYAGGANGAGYVRSDTLVRNLEVRTDGKVIYEKTPWGLIRNRNKEVYALDARLSGVTCIDSATDYQTAEGHLFNLTTATAPEIRCDFSKPGGSGDCLVRVTTIYTDRLVP